MTVTMLWEMTREVEVKMIKNGRGGREKEREIEREWESGRVGKVFISALHRPSPLRP